MTTVTSFSPLPNQPFTLQMTLLGPTTAVTSTGTSFLFTAVWHYERQGWYFQLTDQANNLVLFAPLTACTADYTLNLVGGYFSASQLYLLESSQQIVVAP
jgi:hypothetical protein